MNKKIAVVCNYALNPNRIGGMDRFYKAYDKKAKDLGYEVDWYFIEYSGFDFYADLTIFSSAHQCVESFFLNKVQQEAIKYDILVTHFLALCTPFYKKAKGAGISEIIAVDHNPRPLEGFPIAKIIKNKLKGILYSRYIDQFIGVSDYTRKQILKDYGFFLFQKTKVIYNGIDTSVFKKRIQENKNNFIVCSHLRHSKGIQDLINAVAILEDSVKTQMQIDVFGEGPYETELLTLTHSKNLQDVIHFKGSSSKLNELLSNYSYLIQPTYMECFSLSILESLSANVPVITTTVGGNLEIIKHNENGFIFEPKDVAALSEILKNIILSNWKIDTDVSAKIENEFYLEKMVDEHIKLVL